MATETPEAILIDDGGIMPTLAQWEYKFAVNLGRPFPKHGRLTKWLYETEASDPIARQRAREHPLKNKSVSEYLEEFGRDGWELVTVVSHNDSLLYYFKRKRHSALSG